MASEGLTPENADRDTGLLTRKQRRYLLGKTDIERGTNTDRAMRSRIRQRIRNAFLDFTLLYKHLPADDRETIRPGSGTDEWSAFYQGIGDTLGLIYLILGSEQQFVEDIEWAIKNGEVKRGNVESPFQVVATLDITRSPGMDMEDVATHLANGDYHRIPPVAVMQFLRGLMEGGEFDPTEAYEIYEEWEEGLREKAGQSPPTEDGPGDGEE